MNIFMIGNAYPPTYMGGESAHLFNLVSGLKQRGHTVFVAHPSPAGTDDPPSIRRSMSHNGADIYRFCINETDSPDILNSMLLDTISNLLKEGRKIDLIHCHSNRFAPAVTALTQQYSLPMISTIHAVHIALVQDVIQRKEVPADPQELASYRADTDRQKAVCRASGRIIAVSKIMASWIVKYFDADPQKIRQVYNGIDANRFANFPTQEAVENIKRRLDLSDKTVILFAGRIEPIKGIQSLAAACKILCQKYDQAAVIFMGNGSADVWLRTYLSDCKTVHFVEWQAADAAIPYYHLADIVVVPSLIEPFGLVAVESMACGACVIASNADGLDEIITHNVNGIKIPLIEDEYGDRHIRPEDIYRPLEKAVCEPKWRQALADQGVIRAGDFVLDQMVEKTEAIYSEL